MSLKHKEPNPLAVFNMRRMTFCPPHFQPILFDLKAPEKLIADWLFENTEGRFYLGQSVSAAALCACAAFEVHSEATFFSMFLNQINKMPEIMY